MFTSFTSATGRLLNQIRSKLIGLWLSCNDVSVGSGCHFGRGIKVGRGVVLSSGVVLQDGCELSGAVRLGDKVVIQKCAEIAGNVEVGAGSVIGSYSFVSTMPAARIRIGQRVLVNSFNVVGAGQSVSIEDDCIFAPYVQITDSSHRFRNAGDSPRHDPAISKPVSIGQGVWLGSGAKILMGVQIGDGAVVGAGAVVNRSLPAMAVAVGMPARVVRFRGENEKQESV